MNAILDFSKDIKGVKAVDILCAPHPVLRRRASEVTAEDRNELRTFLPRFFRAMYDAPGIGLAAPQVGISKRFFIMDLSHEDEPRSPRLFINPEIVLKSDALMAREEGCLSLPDQFAEIIRPAKIRLRYQDWNGRIHEEEAEDLKAACIQHELDHLNGVLFVDHLSALKRSIIMRKLVKSQRAQAKK